MDYDNENNTAVLVKTQSEYDDVVAILGIGWDENNFNECEEIVIYMIGWHYSDLEYAKEEKYDIISYEFFKKKK